MVMIGMFFNNLDMLFFIDKSMNFSYFYPSIYSIFIFYIYISFFTFLIIVIEKNIIYMCIFNGYADIWI